MFQVIKRTAAALNKALSHTEVIFNWAAVLYLVGIFGLTIVDTLGRTIGHPFIHSREICVYLMVGLVFLPSAYALRKGQHVSVEIVTKLLPPGIISVLMVITDIIMVVVILFMAMTAWGLLISSYDGGKKASTLLATPL